ncbi:ketohexokinase [Drosophila guanche]|uniref:Blast:Ketohexokinase n=1 Tax=Drosophila guanche TaxID=7266 RepID=A0A3B0J5I3_DROGU|nr:ketohexokinase [Drosophila guanche]SPP77067.1 blast:Ketohexokinase [Drosophila guanche]
MSAPKRGHKHSWAAGKKLVLCSGIAAMDYVSIVQEFPEQQAHCSAGYWQGSGAASNNCTVLRQLGVPCEFFGMLSSLQMYRLIAEDMRSRGIHIEHCPSCAQAPPFSSVILAKSTRTRTLLSCSRQFPHAAIEDFRQLDLKLYGWLHMDGSCVETTRAMMQQVAAFNVAREDKIILSLAPSRDLELMWPLLDLCDYVICSRTLALEQHWPTLQFACAQVDEQLRTRRGLHLKRPTVIFAWGDQGAGILEQSGKYTLSAAHRPRKVVDALGAGDTFTAAFIYAIYVRERPLAVAVDFASRLASHKCTKRGFDHVADILRPPVL